MFWFVLFISLAGAEIYNGTLLLQPGTHEDFAIGRPEEFAYNIISCHNHSINIFVLINTEYEKFINNHSFNYIEEYSVINTTHGHNNILEQSDVDLYIVVSHNCEEAVKVDYRIVTTTFTVTSITLLIIITFIVIVVIFALCISTFSFCNKIFGLSCCRYQKMVETQPLIIMNNRYDKL